jgi:hypothetical protein
MNPQSPPMPRHVPTLTEVIDIQPAVGSPVAEPDVSAAPVLPLPAADVDGASEVPRNLLRGALPTADGATTLPPMSAGVAMPQPATTASPEVLQAARASLSGALRSARDGRWAPMSNAELPGMEDLLDAQPLVLPDVSDTAAQPLPPAVPVMPVAPAQFPAASAVAGEVTEVTEAQLAHRVLGVVQKQIDGMLDFRLREAMTPILQRHTDALVRELRDELKQTMQDVINRAVAQEMAKVRQR